MSGYGKCCICLITSAAIHYHHVIPRSCGGENGPQVPLCGQCHTTLHSHAEAIISSLNTGKLVKKQFWTPDQESRAKPLLKILVDSVFSKQEREFKEFKLLLKMDRELYSALKLLKTDLSLSSLEKTVLFCVKKIARERGLVNERADQKRKKRHFWYHPGND